jgi:hypothetical protein
MEPGRLQFDQAQTLAARRAGARGHVVGSWEAGTRYAGGQQDWWARCRRCRGLVWVLAFDDGRAVIQDVPEDCEPA